MDIYDWCRDHRVHHKFSETNADPHNSKRGFFFAHMGWLMLRKHPQVSEKGSTIDLSDLLADPIVRFQRRYYIPLVLVCWGMIPVLLPMYLWGETFWNAFLFCVAFRYVYVLHVTWNVNSSAHLFGHRPYDVTINPRESKSVTYLSFGEGTCVCVLFNSCHSNPNLSQVTTTIITFSRTTIPHRSLVSATIST